MREGIKLFLYGGLMLIASAKAAATDVGFASGVSGEVKAAQSQTTLQPFSRVENGVTYRLSPGAQLQIIYLATGRQETWDGPCSVTPGTQQGIGKQCPQPSIKQMPPAVLAVVLKSPKVMSDLRSSIGAVRIKAAPNLEAIREMNDIYQELRSQAAALDLTPELYLMSRQKELGLVDAAQDTLRKMQAMQPGNEQIKPKPAAVH